MRIIFTMASPATTPIFICQISLHPGQGAPPRGKNGASGGDTRSQAGQLRAANSGQEGTHAVVETERFVLEMRCRLLCLVCQIRPAVAT